MRGRNRNKGPNPLTRSFESNGPDVKIRGTAQHIAEKYSQLARDAQSSGDPISAENYLQHAEHYYRIIAAAQEQLRQQYGTYQRPLDDDSEEGDEEAGGFGYAPSDRPAPVNGEDMDPGLQPQPFESRGDGERQSDRPQRFERGERQDRRDRFQRSDRPRQDFPRDRRRDNNGRDNNEDEAGSLPAFLTTPVRPPITVEGGANDGEAPSPETGQGEMNGNYGPRRRRRRSRTFGGSDDAGSDTGTDFTAGSADTSAAE